MNEPTRARRFAGMVVALLFVGALPAQALPRGDVRVLGRIVNVLHEGVPAAKVHVTDADGSVLGRTVADGDGFFQLHRLPAGAAELHASSGSFVAGHMRIEARGLVRAATLVLEDGEPLRGTLRRADGTPAANACVLVTTRHRLDPPFDWFAETTTDAQGDWSLPAAPLRPLLLRALSPGVPILEQNLERGGAITGTFAATATKAWRVVVQGATAGTPVFVFCDTRSPYARTPTRWPSPASEVRVDANGEAWLWPLPIPTEVRVRAVGHSCMPIAIPVRGESLPELAFTLSLVPADVAAPSTKVRGRLVDAHGQPLAHVAVVGRDGSRIGPPAVTAADGTFELAVPARPGVLCHVAVQSPDHVLNGRKMETTADGMCWERMRVEPETPLMLSAMEAGGIRDTLHLPAGTPFAAARVQIALTAAGGGVVESATDAAGRFEMLGLPVGTHTVQVFTPSVRGLGKVTVVGGRVSRVDPLEFEASGVVAGVVTDATGRPLPGMAVYASGEVALRAAMGRLVRSSATSSGQPLTDRNGRFCIPGLPIGAWELTAHDLGRDGTAPGASTVQVEAGGRFEVAVVGER